MAGICSTIRMRAALLLPFAFALVLLFGASPAYAANGDLKAGDIGPITLQAQASSGANLTAAKAKFGVADARVLEATNLSDIKKQLKAAGKSATASAPYIVHVPAGNYSLDRIVVPLNVIFVAEDNARFTSSASENAMVVIDGSLYGGYYDAAYKARNGLYFGQLTFSGKNGIIEKATVTRAISQGILAIYPDCINPQIINCTTTNCKENGISVQGGALCKLISGCMTYNNTDSGINISHSNVTAITRCTIKNNGDKAVSTNSDPIRGYKQPGCQIGSISYCHIEGNKTNGVYIKPKCSLLSFTHNTVINNADGLVCASKTEAGTTGKSFAKNINNNVFKNNKREQVVARFKGATIYLGSSNKILNGKRTGAYADQKGVFKIIGKNNVIQGNKVAGFSITGNGKLIISGSNNKIQSNKGRGIFVRSGNVSITGAKTQINKNAKGGISAFKKSTISITGKNLQINGNKDAGIFATDKSKLTLKSKGGKIQKNKGAGVSISGKTTATIKSVKFSGNKGGDKKASGGAKIK